MKKHTFIWGAIILTIGGFIAKLIGAFYKIPLTNILGSSGMGLYYLVFPLYNLFLVFSSSGVSIAITRLIAEARANKNKRNETKYFYAGITISLIFSSLFSLFVIVFAKQLAYAQGNILSYMSFLAIAPSIIFASLVTVIKGYFQGVENMFPSSIALIFEQIIKLIIGLLLSYKLVHKGIEYAVMGSVLAVSISEAATLIVMMINYVWHKTHNDYKFYTKDVNTSKLRELKPKNKISKKINLIIASPPRKCRTFYITKDQHQISFFRAIKNTFKLMLPNTMMSLITPLITLIDSFLVINLLTDVGYSSLTATSLYGINNGVVSSLISLPVIITSAIATAIVPNLSGLVYLGRKNEITSRCSFFIKITWIIVLPIFMYFFIMNNEIVSALYKFGSGNVINEFGFACKILLISSISIIYNALLSTFISILQAINKPYKVFFILLSGLILRTLISIILLNQVKINIFGVVFANIFFQMYCGLLCLNVIRHNINLNINIFRSFIVPSIACAMAGGVVYIVRGIVLKLNNWLVLGVCGIVCIVIYFVLIVVCKCFDHGDTKYMPILNKIYKLK